MDLSCDFPVGGNEPQVEVEPLPTEIWRAMTDHLFLPRKLDLSLSDQAGPKLARHFLRFLKGSDIQLSVVVDKFLNFIAQPPNTQQLADALQQPDLTILAVPLMKHNAVVVFNTKNQNNDSNVNNILVSAFDILPNSSSIHSMTNDIEPFPSACRLALPRRSIEVPREEATSPIFLEQLAALGGKFLFPLREPKNKKTGHEVTETRKPASSTYVFDWLLNTLQHSYSPRSQSEVFSKSIRLDSVRIDRTKKPWTRSAVWVALKSLVHLCLVQLHDFNTGTQLYKCLMLQYQASFVDEILEMHLSGDHRRDFGELKEMCAYLTRKAAKLQQFFPTFCTQVLKKVCGTCEMVDQSLTNEWKSYLENEKEQNQIDFNALGKIESSDIWNPLSSVRSALEEAISTDSTLEHLRTSRRQSFVDTGTQRCVQQMHISSPDLLNQQVYLRLLMENLMKDMAFDRQLTSENLERVLQLTESFIRLRLWPSRDEIQSDVEPLLDASHRLLVIYQKQCTVRYQNDPIRLSKMLLHCCTLVAWMDAVYVRWEPLQLTKNHQLFAIPAKEMENLLLMDARDVALLHQVHDYITQRTNDSLKPGIVDTSDASLAFCYASADASMLHFEEEYFKKDEMAVKDKEQELATAKLRYAQKKAQVDKMTCECADAPWWCQRTRCERWGRCSHVEHLDVLEHIVSIYEKRFPDDVVKRRTVIFHKLMPKPLLHLIESSAFVVSLGLSRCGPAFLGDPYNWADIDYSRSIALGSKTKPFVKTHYGKNISIFTSSSNFVVPQGKTVDVVFKLASGAHHFFEFEKWDLSSYNQLPIEQPFQGLKFAAHGTSHNENDVLAIQCACPAELELVSFQDFGTLRAGGYLQWRNIAVAFDGSALDLNSRPVAMLILQAVYQVGPLPTNLHWNFDLNEENFVNLLCSHIELAVERMKHNWSAFRALFVCISVLTYLTQHVPPNLMTRPVQLLTRCRQVSVQWSDSLEQLCRKDASRSSNDAERIITLLYINSLIILTFACVDEHPPEVNEQDLSVMLRARAIMYQQRHVTRDEELERIVSLSSRVMARYEDLIHQQLAQFEFRPLHLVATSRWPQCETSSWTRCADSHFYRTKCHSLTSIKAFIYFNVFDGGFLVDGEPIGRLPDRILTHDLFQRNFPTNLLVLHRGGGVFETINLQGVVYTFALVHNEKLIVREQRNERSYRLISSENFSKDLPQPLVDKFSFWMTCSGPKLHIELRRPTTQQKNDFQPEFRIDLRSDLHGRVEELKTGRTLLNFCSHAFDAIFKAFVWRLDIKSFVIPYLPKRLDPSDSDEWSLCLHLHRLHQHIEMFIENDNVKFQIREFDNMVVSSNQFLGTLVGLDHLLVLERRNGIRTVIVPHLSFRTDLNEHHLKVIPESSTPNAELPFFSFDEDPSLKQIRPHGSETLASWLMCVYLHAITSSAMRDPLTQLTGLEMAVTQMRRFQSNQPLDKMSRRILAKIGRLSPSRSIVCDTEVVQWDHTRPPYSSSEVYRLLAELIQSKTSYLDSLYSTEGGSTVSFDGDDTMTARAYFRYEWSWSEDGKLTDSEKDQLQVAPKILPSLQFDECVSSNNVHRFVHSVKCLESFKELVKMKSPDFTWTLWFKKSELQPVASLPEHVGKWSEYKFNSAFLSLCTAALELNESNDPERLKRFALMLSFVVWKDDRLLSPAIGLMEIIRSEVHSASILERHQLPKDTTEPGSRYLSEDVIRKQLLEAQTSNSDRQVVQAIGEEFPTLIAKIQALDIWGREGTNLVTNELKSNYAFTDILSDSPRLNELFNYQTFASSLTEYYNLLFNQQQIFLFGCAIDLMKKNPKFCQSCITCYAPPHMIMRELANPQVNIRSGSQPLHFRKQNVVHGKCLELEREFRKCLVKIPVIGENCAFPLELDAEMKDSPIGCELLTALQESWAVYHDSRTSAGTVDLNGTIPQIRQMLGAIGSRSRRLVDKSWQCLQKVLEPSHDQWVSRCSQAAGLVSMAAPRTLFPRYGRTQSGLSIEARSLLGEHLVYLVYLQKATRCLEMVDTWESTAEDQRQHFGQRLTREISEPHCEDWSPEVHHKWLLFEVEWNVFIRRIQAQVALKIIQGEEQILQLNMGEGKTSVISPLVCSSLADQKHVAQLTLMTSLLETHGQELALKLGGLLEQPVYYFPCRRNVRFNARLINRMISNFRQCVKQGGCIVTVPEFRLSLLLKLEEMCVQQLVRSNGEILTEMFDGTHVTPTANADVSDQVMATSTDVNSAVQSDVDMSSGEEEMSCEDDESSDEQQFGTGREHLQLTSEIKGLLELLDLHRAHLIDIIDESDEILRHKYQLLYTIGSQQTIDAGERRWQVLQAILNLILHQPDENDPSCDSDEQHSPTFPDLRDEQDDQRLVANIVDGLLVGRYPELAYLSTLNSRRKQVLRKYLCNQIKSSDDLGVLSSELTEQQLKDVLILRGLLSYGVLPHAIRKRWSVDYGVDVITKRRLMAVPFRGKDTPMPRTEFGHPDVSLVLTHFSYYHTGLNQQQVKEALIRLKQMPQGQVEYQVWLEDVKGQRRVVSDVNSINLDDVDQLKILGRALRYSRACIHFWLNCCVLPKETRQFPFKLMATSWDLAREHSQPMRGFSGTKDSSYLLPANVRLGSLPQLQGTDGEVLARVTNPCNRRVSRLDSDSVNVTARSVIDFIVDKGNGNILIDCGALMVGMSNRQVASYWLSKAPATFMAAAYFEGDRIMVLLRDGHQTPLNFSPLKGRLANVLIYMDDIHTRGTDFKFPIPAHGYVTLGRDLPKDKLVQACMRMRHLGHGHSISFMAPSEIFAQLSTLANFEPPDSRHVIQWSLRNTIAQIQSGLLEWASQGLHFSRRVTAMKMFRNRHQSGVIRPEHLKFFVALVLIPETLNLNDMYEAVQDTFQASFILHQSKKQHIRKMSELYRSMIQSQSPKESKILDDVQGIASIVVQHCDKYVGGIQMKSKCFDEEQEKELEEEEEREVDRPGNREAFQPNEPEWISLVNRGVPISSIEEFTPLWDAMKHSTVYELLSSEDFDPRILTTYNFRRTLKFEENQQDEFLRSPRWMLALWSSASVHHLILISPYEANTLVSILRSSQIQNASLHRFAPRTRRDQAELLISDLTLWPGN